jgi:serine/threonine protein kinase
MLYEKKYRKYLRKMEKIAGGLLCDIRLPTEISSLMKSKMEFTGTHRTFFTKNEGENVVQIVFEKKSGTIIPLGRGGSGEVYKGIATVKSASGDIINNFQVAIKMMTEMEQIKQNSMCAELLLINEIQGEIQHENIVKYIGFAESIDEITRREFFYIFMEYLDGEDMLKYVMKHIKYNSSNIDEKIYIADQLLNCLHYTHQNGIYHRDIKPDNIYIIRDSSNKPIVKYIDFGFSCRLDFTCKYSVHNQGTMSFLSPEMAQHIVNKTEDKNLYPQYDLWALGHTLYLLFSEKNLYSSTELPLSREHHPQFLSRITQSYIDKKIERNLSFLQPDMKNIIVNLLKVDNTQRQLYLLERESVASALRRSRERTIPISTEAQEPIKEPIKESIKETIST